MQKINLLALKAGTEKKLFVNSSIVVMYVSG